MSAATRVLFLDIDGVLNSVDYVKRRPPCACGSMRDLVRCIHLGHSRHMDPLAVARVDEITRRTGAVVVLSSSWRTFVRWRQLVGEMLRVAGFSGRLIGRTPEMGRTDPRRVLPETERVQRGEEIAAWLAAHPGVESFAILDDDGDMEPVADRFVQTDPEHGLLAEHVERAVALLESTP